MAQEYIAMKEKENGMIALSTNVFSSIANICVQENKDVVLAEQTRFKSSIQSKVVNDELIVQVNVKVRYNSNVAEVCAKLQHTIFENIKHMCDLEAEVVDIQVVGFDFQE